MADKTKKEEDQTVASQMRERTVGYITAALGLVAGLAWNDAIRSMIDIVYPMKPNSVIAKFLYAAIITIVVVFAGFYMARLASTNFIRHANRHHRHYK